MRCRTIEVAPETWDEAWAGTELWDFALVHEGRGVLAWGEACVFEIGAPWGGGAGGGGSGDAAGAGCGAGAPLAELKRLARDGARPLVVGALPFDPRARGRLSLPRRSLRMDESGRCWLTEVGASMPTRAQARRRPAMAGEGPRLVGLQQVVGRDAFCAMVREALREIGRHGEAAGGSPAVTGSPDPAGGAGGMEGPGRTKTAGRVDKVVLSRAVLAHFDGEVDPAILTGRLAGLYPSSWAYSCSYGAAGLVGASPELLVRRRGRSVVSEPTAGTSWSATEPAGPGATLARSEKALARSEKALARSEKDGREHEIVVRAVLDELSVDHEVNRAERRVVRKGTVDHLVTRIEATSSQPEAAPALELVTRLHPTPAVAGHPRELALEAIARIEGRPRSFYAGPVGWMGSSGDGDWVLALRGGEIEGDAIRLVTGVGIVEGSDPDLEWEETEAKLATMLAALGAGGGDGLADPTCVRR
ncbi:MAG: isochorismate synthase [Acidimicrobiales bacterium]